MSRNETELMDLLGYFGLSEKEIYTYLSILELGDAKVSDIADAADVSRPYVYKCSEKLEEQGFVEVNDYASPTTIRAIPPDEVLSRVDRNIGTLRSELEQRYSSAAPLREEFRVITQRNDLVEYLNKLIRVASDELILSIPRPLLPEVEGSLRAVDHDEVLVELLVTGNDALDVQAEEMAWGGLASVVRTWDWDSIFLMTVDREFGIVAPREMQYSNSDLGAILLDRAQLVPLHLGSFMGSLWPMGEEVYVADPSSLPRTVSSVHLAVFEAAVHIQDDVPLQARIECVPNVGDDDVRTLEGPVTDTFQSFVRPTTNSFAFQSALALRVDGEAVTFGAANPMTGVFTPDAEVVEDYEAKTIRLFRGDG